MNSIEHVGVGNQLRVRKISYIQQRLPEVTEIVNTYSLRAKEQIIQGNLLIDHSHTIELIKMIVKTPKAKRERIDTKLLRGFIVKMKHGFSNLDLLDMMINSLELEFKTADSFIIHTYEYYKKLYILIEGKCEIISPLNESSMVENQHSFGQKQLNENLKSEVKVKCATPCTFLVIRRQEYNMYKKQYRIKQLKQIERTICNVPIFKNFDNETAKKIAKITQIVTFGYKEQLVKQSEKHDYFYIITEGEFKATYYTSGGSEHHVIHFGQYETILIESLFSINSLFRICSLINESKGYKISVEKFCKALVDNEQYLTEIREYTQNKIQYFYALIQKIEKVSPIEKISTQHKSHRIMKREYQTLREKLFIRTNRTFMNGEDIKLKTKYFKNDLALESNTKKRSSTIDTSCTIRSRTANPKHILNMYNQTNNERENNITLYKIYKQKLQEGPIELDIIKKLYSKERSPISQDHERMMRTKKEQTEILMKRIQITSCRKRRNKNQCLFDPQDIVQYSLDV